MRKKQIEWLHRFASFSQVSRLGLWVCGGWAVEALTEEQYPREHSDINCLVFRLHSAAFHVFALRSGFQLMGDYFHGFAARKLTGMGPVVVEFDFLDWDEVQRLVTYLPEHTICWPCTDLAQLPELPLGGKLAPCFDWEMIYAASEVRSLLHPEKDASPDSELVSKQVKAPRRKAIVKDLVISFQPD
ncbi:MAG: hypothetical protein A2Y63_03720 [Candidatus Riflebacteria bacterium RBG_13_59_9]|nr:MAG: hypothetical protein A2Y63_03720 [Candidatus Riflebacteria bacterium RBG_13_59_9]